MQKIRKILRTVSEKTALPTNQPTNQLIITNNTDFIGPGSRWSKNILQIKKQLMQLIASVKVIFLVYSSVKQVAVTRNSLETTW